MTKIQRVKQPDIVTVYSFKVLRTRCVKTGYFFDTNTKNLKTVDNYKYSDPATPENQKFHLWRSDNEELKTN